MTTGDGSPISAPERDWLKFGSAGSMVALTLDAATRSIALTEIVVRSGQVRFDQRDYPYHGTLDVKDGVESRYYCIDYPHHCEVLEFPLDRVEPGSMILEPSPGTVGVQWFDIAPVDISQPSHVVDEKRWSGWLGAMTDRRDAASLAQEVGGEVIGKFIRQELQAHLPASLLPAGGMVAFVLQLVRLQMPEEMRILFAILMLGACAAQAQPEILFLTTNDARLFWLGKTWADKVSSLSISERRLQWIGKPLVGGGHDAHY